MPSMLSIRFSSTKSLTLTDLNCPAGRMRSLGPQLTIGLVDVYVGARLRTRRAMLGMSQSRLGELLGVTYQQVQKYEKGRNRISASRLKLAAEVLQVSVDYFYKGGPPQDSENGQSGLQSYTNYELSKP